MLFEGVLAKTLCTTFGHAMHLQRRRLTSSLASLLGLACQDCFNVPKTWSITSLGSIGSLLGPSAHQSRHHGKVIPSTVQWDYNQDSMPLHSMSL